VLRYLRFTLPALLAFGLASASRADGVNKPDTANCKGDYGTSVHFEKSPSDAAKKALKEEKLVCVLHISGYFEEPDYT